MNTVIKVLTSLRLTVICLALALGLVFIGTLAQVKHGLYIVQEQFFNSWLVWWAPSGGSFKIPVWPGGYLLGGLLLVNLIAAHIQRFELSRKKFGIFVVHAGLILLLVGQLFTQLFQIESFMSIEEGTSKNYSESGRFAELAVVDRSDPKTDLVVAIPQRVLAHNSEISNQNLPFKVKVNAFNDNVDPELAEGASKLDFVKRPYQTSMNSRNIPGASVSIETPEGVIGPFQVSNWTSEKNLIATMSRMFGQRFSTDWLQPAAFDYKGRHYELRMRPVRYYKPYTIKLLDFKHDIYKGTDIPKAFSSRIQLMRPDTGENREILIYMNNPLRYAGETYYQGGFEEGDTVSILQVVRNPGWITPYVACIMVGGGLLIQFLSHLFAFAKKRRTA